MQCHLPSSTALQVHVVVYQKTHVVAQNFPIILYNVVVFVTIHVQIFLPTQALYIHPDEPYSLHWPMRGGHLNLHDGPGGSLTAVCADLETLWAYAIQTHLAIPLRDLGVCFPS